MNNLLKVCKVCKIEHQRQGDFSGRSALSCKCVYEVKKIYFKKYYENNGEKMKQYERVKYDKENPTGQKRPYNRKKAENTLI